MASIRDVIVMGASAGGVEPLQHVAREMPQDLPAALFVVMHVPPRTKSFLPEILNRAGGLKAVHPRDGDPIRRGCIYVAPPDHHLVIEHEHVHLTCGPKEQHHRPCINVTFRSAASAYGERVAGVLLSGELDDGTAGLWEIQRRGGVTIVQNPEEAAFPSMPLSALREIEVNHTVTVREIGPLLRRLAGDGERPAIDAAEMEYQGLEIDPELTDLTCPECRGTIWAVSRGDAKDYRCRVGHAYSPKSMLASHFAAQEKALYAALVALEEGASLTSQLADQFDPEVAERLRTESRQREHQAEAIRNLLKDRVSFDIDEQVKKR
ncbi:MAG: chemotaxis protein CheB [Acidobacteriaceae bacterium]|nr:chemotaxis protein CheB [Acidobacteriaceae bacterium]